MSEVYRETAIVCGCVLGPALFMLALFVFDEIRRGRKAQRELRELDERLNVRRLQR